MKIFISFDMEGFAGIVDWSQRRAPGQPYEEGRKLLLGEVNAAIDGAAEIVCNDSHGTRSSSTGWSPARAGSTGSSRWLAGRPSR